jgi:hypothetical protein
MEILRQGPIGAFNRGTDKLTGSEMTEREYNEHINQAEAYYTKLTDPSEARSLIPAVVSMALIYFREVDEIIKKRLKYLKNKKIGYGPNSTKFAEIGRKIMAVETNETTNNDRISNLDTKQREPAQILSTLGGKIRKTRKSRNSRRKGKSKKRRAR